MSHIDLNDVDVDGAVREAEEAVAGDTRASFFKKAAITGGGVGSAALFTGMLPSVAQGAPSKRQDIAILKFALTHVTALRRTIRSLGSKVPSEPDFDFQGTNKGDKFLPTALVLENTGVRAYLGQAGRLQSKALLAAAASIATVEARHAAAIALLQNPGAFTMGKRSISPSGSFDRATSMSKILGEVRATKFIKSS